MYWDAIQYAFITSRLFIDRGFANLFSEGRLLLFMQRINAFMNADIIGKIFGSGMYESVTYGDNDYGRILYTYGVMGLTLYLSYHLSVLGLVIANWKKRGTYFIIIAHTLLVILSITTDSFRYPSFLILYFTLIVIGIKEIRSDVRKSVKILKV